MALCGSFIKLEKSSRDAGQKALGALAIILLAAFSLDPLLAESESLAELPNIDRYVIDKTNTLTDLQKQEATEILKRIENENGSQVVLVLVPTTKPETIEQYSLRLAEQEKIGRKDVDDGVLVLLAKNDRRVRIEVGYGLEGAIPDATANRIIDTIMIPEFKKGEFYVGLRNGILALEKQIKKEPLPQPAQEEAIDTGIPWSYYFYELWYYWSWAAYGLVAVMGWYAAKNKKYGWILAWALLIGMHPPILWTFMEGFFIVFPFFPRFLISLFVFHVAYWLSGGKPPAGSGRSASGRSRSSSSYSPSFSSFSSSSFSSVGQPKKRRAVIKARGDAMKSRE